MDGRPNDDVVTTTLDDTDGNGVIDRHEWHQGWAAGVVWADEAAADAASVAEEAVEAVVSAEVDTCSEQEFDTLAAEAEARPARSKTPEDSAEAPDGAAPHSPARTF